jgi:hypothetical protein
VVEVLKEAMRFAFEDGRLYQRKFPYTKRSLIIILKSISALYSF